MPNPAAAQLIADRLAGGLPHPGNKTTNQPAIAVKAFSTAGMTPQQAKIINTTTKLYAEAIIHVIERELDGLNNHP